MPLSPTQFGGCIAEHMDILLFAVSRHFGRRQRWEAAVDFFSRLSGVYTPAAVYVAAVQRELGQFEDTLRTLSAAVEAEPHCTQLLVALAGECLSAQQVETASKLARRALRIDAGLRPAWLVLARCYVRQDEPGLALVTLNIVPTPPTPLGKEAVRRGPDPGGASKRGCARMRTSRASSRCVREVALVSHHHTPPPRPARRAPAVTVSVERQDGGPVDGILAPLLPQLTELVGLLGWDAFLDLRSSIFVMHAETEAGSGATQQQQQQEGQGQPQRQWSSRSLVSDGQQQQQRDATASVDGSVDMQHTGGTAQLLQQARTSLQQQQQQQQHRPGAQRSLDRQLLEQQQPQQEQQQLQEQERRAGLSGAASGEDQSVGAVAVVDRERQAQAMEAGIEGIFEHLAGLGIGGSSPNSREAPLHVPAHGNTAAAAAAASHSTGNVTSHPEVPTAPTAPLDDAPHPQPAPEPHGGAPLKDRRAYVSHDHVQEAS
ncbi:MAG: hypothetical protein WDW38_008115 [Sanguina aurantia]